MDEAQGSGESVHQHDPTASPGRRSDPGDAAVLARLAMAEKESAKVGACPAMNASDSPGHWAGYAGKEMGVIASCSSQSLAPEAVTA
ncbi:hypothetical protein GCM10023346_38240 [Arthrobacter gyeryongensis]|uniref:Uncharacterized protein n=1 Tax=Arthrobacter gyeryongensis TaxID=1650592 RepID=A0ABP9SQ30_9MICC